MKISAPNPRNWPTNAPPYHSLAGWEYEKLLELKRLKKQFNIK